MVSKSKSTLKDMSEFRDTTCDQYRESGFKFFNQNILQFAYDISLTLLERISYVNIVQSNYKDK